MSIPLPSGVFGQDSILFDTTIFLYIGSVCRLLYLKEIQAL